MDINFQHRLHVCDHAPSLPWRIKSRLNVTPCRKRELSVGTADCSVPTALKAWLSGQG